jgi:hypothetical protein
MTTRSDQFRGTESHTVHRPRARRVEARLHKAGLSICGKLRSAFAGQSADLISRGTEVAWKQLGRRYF